MVQWDTLRHGLSSRWVRWRVLVLPVIVNRPDILSPSFLEAFLNPPNRAQMRRS
jgi:hypothetical protein